MVYAVSDIARREAQNPPSAGLMARGRIAKSRAAQPAVSIHWPRTIALGLNAAVWISVIAGARWFFHH